jgi:type IX secretion system PorP/SprF family membrane protein
MFAMMNYNAGYAGASKGISATGLMRQQWMGFKDAEGNKIAPTTTYITIDSPLKFIHGGLSATLMQDNIGFQRINQLSVGYAYRFNWGDGDFGAGLKINLINPKIDFAKFVAYNDPQSDPVLAEKTGEESDIMFDGSLGVFYQVPDKYYAGLSVENLMQTMGKKTYYTLKRTIYATGGYFWPIPGSPTFELQPSAWIGTDFATYQISISALLEYNKKFYGGLAYRYQDAVSILAGVNIKGLRIGASYDLVTSKLFNYNSGSIEILLSYCFKIETEKLRRSYRNTRFL